MVQESSYTGQRGKTSIEVTMFYTKSSFLSTKKSGNKGSLIDTDQSWLSLTPPTRPPSMRCHCFSYCVHTNVGYKVAGEFICENEDAESIAEALQIIKSWNVGWSPSFFMVDFSTAVINAIENEFPTARVHVCNFHRNQAWNRWVRSGRSGLDSKQQEILLSLLHQLAKAREHSRYEAALGKLHKSSVYTHHSNVQEYVENVWMTCVKRWAQAFRQQQILNIVNTNNGVEAQNKHFKYDYLPRSVEKSVFGIAVLLVESFIPDAYQHYVDTNLKQSSLYRGFDDRTPSYLWRVFSVKIQTINSNIPSFNSNIQSFNSNIQSFNSNIPSFNSNIQSFNSNIQSFNSNMELFVSNIRFFNQNTLFFNPEMPFFELKMHSLYCLVYHSVQACISSIQTCHYSIQTFNRSIQTCISSMKF